MGESERERAQRIRDAQIKARDHGGSKVPGYDWKKHAARGREIKAKRRKLDQRPLLIRLYEVIPERAQYAIMGFRVGAILALVGLLFVAEEWQLLLIIPPLIFAGAGYLIGMMLEPDRDIYGGGF